MKTVKASPFFQVMAVLLALTMLLSACATPAATPQVTEPTASAPQSATQSAPTGGGEISVLYLDNPTWWSEQAKRFTAESGINVNWQGVPFDKLHDTSFTAFAAGSYPWDVIHVRDDYVSEFGSRGFLMPLDDFITPEFKGQFSEQAWKNLSLDGHIYGVPRYFWLYQFYYNKDILSAGGYSEPPKTWDEVAQMADTLTKDTNGDGKIDQWGYCEPWGENFVSTAFMIHLRAAGGEVFDSSGNPLFNSDAGVKGLTWMANMAKTDNFCPSAWEMQSTGTLTQLLLQGVIAMVDDTPQVYGMAADTTQSKVQPTKLGAALVPGDVVPSGTYAETGGLAIPTGAKNPQGAWKYIEFVTSQKEEVKMATEKGVGNVPANLSAFSDPTVQNKSPNFSLVKDQMQYSFGMLAKPNAQEINGILCRYIIEALHGNLTPKDALDKAYQEILPLVN